MLTLTTAYEAQLTHEWAQRGGWDRSCRAPLPSAHPPNNATLLCSLELQKPYVIGCFSPCFCLLPSLPANVLEFLIGCSFSSRPLNCNGPTFKGLVHTCLAPRYLIIMHLLMSHSRKLAHSSDDASTAQISPSERRVQSP